MNINFQNLSENERVHHCSESGYMFKRDYASAQIIEQSGLLAVKQMVS